MTITRFLDTAIKAGFEFALVPWHGFAQKEPITGAQILKFVKRSESTKLDEDKLRDIARSIFPKYGKIWKDEPQDIEEWVMPFDEFDEDHTFE